MLLLLVNLAEQASAASARNRLIGDWRIEVDVDGRSIPFVLTLTKGKKDGLSGNWISIWGVDELTAIEPEGNEIRIAWTTKFGDREMRTSLAGTIATPVSRRFNPGSPGYRAEARRHSHFPLRFAQPPNQPSLPGLHRAKAYTNTRPNRTSPRPGSLAAPGSGHRRPATETPKPRL